MKTDGNLAQWESLCHFDWYFSADIWSQRWSLRESFHSVTSVKQRVLPFPQKVGSSNGVNHSFQPWVELLQTGLLHLSIPPFLFEWLRVTFESQIFLLSVLFLLSSFLSSFPSHSGRKCIYLVIPRSCLSFELDFYSLFTGKFPWREWDVRGRGNRL